MLEIRDKATGIIRHQIDTTNSKLGAEHIRCSCYVLRSEKEGDAEIFHAEVSKLPIMAKVFPTRIILLSPSKLALEEFEENISVKEWEYDNYR